MPKNRKVIKVDGATKVIKVPNKLCIGTRKSGTSATLMSTERLIEVAKNKSQKRYWDNAIHVLRQRGILVPA